jgi:hypothetical protein
LFIKKIEQQMTDEDDTSQIFSSQGDAEQRKNFVEKHSANDIIKKAIRTADNPLHTIQMIFQYMDKQAKHDKRYQILRHVTDIVIKEAIRFDSRTIKKYLEIISDEVCLILTFDLFSRWIAYLPH